jgi:hypothetical protein
MIKVKSYLCLLVEADCFTPYTPPVILFSAMAKTKRLKFMQYHGPAATKHKHIRYVTNPDGRLKISTSFVTVKSNNSMGDAIDDKLLLGIDDILSNAAALDPAYIEHLAEAGIEPP